MGFSAPSPDPQLVAEQKRQAAQAKQDRISLITQQLDTEDQLRQQLYGRRSLMPALRGGTGTTGGTTGGTGGSGPFSAPGWGFIPQVLNKVFT